MSDRDNPAEVQEPIDASSVTALDAVPISPVAPGGASDRDKQLQQMVDDANTEMLKKYNEEWFATPERIRARANSALTASSAIATVLGFGTLVAGISDNFQDETPITFGLLLATFVAWVVAALVSIFVLAGNVPYPAEGPEPGDGMSIDALLSFIPRWAEHEAAALRGRMRVAMSFAGIALALTVGAMVSSVVADRVPPLVEAEVIFDESVEVPLEEVCDLEFSPVPVRILGPDDIDRDQDTVEMAIVGCDGESTRKITVLWTQVKALVYR